MLGEACEEGREVRIHGLRRDGWGGGDSGRSGDWQKPHGDAEQATTAALTPAPSRREREMSRPLPGGSGDVYLMASIGESLEARMAGYMPKVTASSRATTHATTRPTGLTTRP
jgi:hypothetical protein